MFKHMPKVSLSTGYHLFQYPQPSGYSAQLWLDWLDSAGAEKQLSAKQEIEMKPVTVRGFLSLWVSETGRNTKHEKYLPVSPFEKIHRTDSTKYLLNYADVIGQEEPNEWNICNGFDEQKISGQYRYYWVTRRWKVPSDIWASRWKMLWRWQNRLKS